MNYQLKAEIEAVLWVLEALLKRHPLGLAEKAPIEDDILRVRRCLVTNDKRSISTLMQALDQKVNAAFSEQVGSEGDRA